jgi:hypothetical protein
VTVHRDPKLVHSQVLETFDALRDVAVLVVPTRRNPTGRSGSRAAGDRLGRLKRSLDHFPTGRLDPDPFLREHPVPGPAVGRVEIVGTSVHDAVVQAAAMTYRSLHIPVMHRAKVKGKWVTGPVYEDLGDGVSTLEIRGKKVATKVNRVGPVQTIHFTEVPWSNSTWDAIEREHCGWLFRLFGDLFETERLKTMLIHEAPRPARHADGNGSTTTLSPDQFEFENGIVGSGFTQKDLRLLRAIRNAGAAGIPIDALCTALAHPVGPAGRKRIEAQVTRTTNRIDGHKPRLPFVIESINSRYCLTRLPG